MLRLFYYIFILLFISSCAGSPDTISKNVIPEGGISGESVESMPSDENKFNIALLVPKETNKEQITNSIIQASQIAVSEDKKAKINVVVIDSALISQDPKSLENQLHMNKISTIVGPVYAKETIELAKITENKNITIFSLSNDSSINNSSVIIMGASPYSQATSLANFAISQGIDDFYLLLPSNKYGKIIESAVQNLVTEKNDINFNVTWYNQENAESTVSELVNLIASKPKDSLRKRAIFMPQGGKFLTTLNDSLQAKKLKIQLVGSQAWDNESTLNYPYFNGALLLSKQNHQDELFYTKYKELFKSEASNIDYAAFNSIKIIQKMLKNHSSFNKATITENYPEIFDASGNLIQESQIIQVQNKQFKAVE